jgi:hypothetical protein
MQIAQAKRFIALKKMKLSDLYNQKKTTWLGSLVLLCFSALSQSTETTSASGGWVNPEHTQEDYMDFKQGWFIGADAGKTVYYGDVALYNVFPKTSEFRQSMGNCGSFYFGKKFKFGLAAEVQGFKGSLQGEKISGRLYHRYFNADFYQYSVNVKYNLSQLVFRDIPGRKVFNRFTVYLTAGGGQMFFRSRLYKLAVDNNWYLENTNGYSNTGIDSAGPTSAGGNVVDRTKMHSAIAIPAGAKINFKLNGKTDVVLDATYSTVLTDDLDSWKRTWSHQDRYLYLGLGLVYNLFADGDIPDDQRIFRPRDKTAADAYDKDEAPKAERKGLFNFGGKSKGNKKDDRDLEVRMKMYELQLKLFEMQYLMNQ